MRTYDSQIFSRWPLQDGTGPVRYGYHPKGTIIAEYRGRHLRNEQADKLADRGNKYLYEINNRWTIDGSNRRNLARYANHSCRPNAKLDVTRQKKVIIRAIKKIGRAMKSPTITARTTST